MILSIVGVNHALPQLSRVTQATNHQMLMSSPLKFTKIKMRLIIIYREDASRIWPRLPYILTESINIPKKKQRASGKLITHM